MYEEMRLGNEPSAIYPEDDVILYSTAWGGIEFSYKTGELTYCCTSIDRDNVNRWLGIDIQNGEFRVHKIFCPPNRGVGQTLYSPNWKYDKGDGGLTPAYVFKSLAADSQYGWACVQTKKELVRLIQKNIKLTREDKQELQNLFKIWRKPIITKRTPIIRRNAICYTEK